MNVSEITLSDYLNIVTFLPFFLILFLFGLLNKGSVRNSWIFTLLIFNDISNIWLLNALKNNCYEANCIFFNNFNLLFPFIMSRGLKMLFCVAPRTFTKALEKTAHKWLLSISKYMIIQCLHSPTEPCLCLALAFSTKKILLLLSKQSKYNHRLLWCIFCAKKDKQRLKVLHASHSEANATRFSTWYKITHYCMDYIVLISRCICKCHLHK